MCFFGGRLIPSSCWSHSYWSIANEEALHSLQGTLPVNDIPKSHKPKAARLACVSIPYNLQHTTFDVIGGRRQHSCAWWLALSHEGHCLWIVQVILQQDLGLAYWHCNSMSYKAPKSSPIDMISTDENFTSENSYTACAFWDTKVKRGAPPPWSTQFLMVLW